MPEIKSVQSFERILSIVNELSSLEEPQARSKYVKFPGFAAHISKLFREDRLYDILPRMEVELEIIKKYSPAVRPALDPYVSTQIGVFSGNFSDWEVGFFLGYPECCMKPFAEEARYGLDERHAAELGRLKGKIFVTTAGFIPHSVFCGESLANGLISFVSEVELGTLRQLEKEMSARLPHMHSAYQGQYYEVRMT